MVSNSAAILLCGSNPSAQWSELWECGSLFLRVLGIVSTVLPKNEEVCFYFMSALNIKIVPLPNFTLITNL